MKILAINGGTQGSSWEINKSILLEASNLGHQVFVATPCKNPHIKEFNYYKIGNKFLRFVNRIATKLDGSDGFRNKLSTKLLIRFISKIKPDVVHLHTLHGYFINIKLLINYLKGKGIKLIITCHDCWWFTGRCSHFYFNNCNKWKIDCANCEFKSVYPKALLLNRSSKYLKEKIKLFKDYDKLTVACVSNWLAELCEQSLVFKDAKIVTIHNGVDQAAFCVDSTINKNLNQIICVSAQWTESKGIELIVKISELFPQYTFLVIGALKNKVVPKNILNVPCVRTKKELADLYRSSLALLNPSKQETFSLVNIEAQLCGIPVVCLNKTGMKETIAPASFPVDEYTVEQFSSAMTKIKENPCDPLELSQFAQRFSLETMIEQYISIYLGGIKNE